MTRKIETKLSPHIFLSANYAAHTLMFQMNSYAEKNSYENSWLILNFEFRLAYYLTLLTRIIYEWRQSLCTATKNIWWYLWSGTVNKQKQNGLESPPPNVVHIDICLYETSEYLLLVSTIFIDLLILCYICTMDSCFCLLV